MTRLADLRTAMPAGIMEAAQDTVLAAHDHDRRTPDRKSHMGTGLRQLCLEAGQKPVPAIYRHQIGLEHVRIGVEPLRQSTPRLALVQQ